MSAGLVGGLLVASVLALAALWLWIERKTLTDDIPGNHITAVWRAAVKKQPGPFILFAFALGYLAGHLTWP